MAPLVLASASPRRTAILSRLGIAHEVRPADVDERVEGDPSQLALENARLKAIAVAEEDELVLGCDTVVALDGRILPKPEGADQAREWLRILSGRVHEVVGGLALLGEDRERSGVAVTQVRFRPLSERLIDWYLETGEWEGKAGAYAIQGCGAGLVEEIAGDYLNVVGLPVALLLELAPELLGVP